MKTIHGRMMTNPLKSCNQSGKMHFALHGVPGVRAAARVIFTLLLPILSLTSCQVSGWIDNYLRTPTPGEILFQDDFSENTGIWQTWSGSNTRIDYDSGGLRFFVNEVNQDYWARPGKDYKDVQIGATAEKMSGPNDNQYGIICRYKNSENFYYFAISSDGYFGIVRVQEGVYTILNDVDMQYSEWIHQGEAVNRLSARCSASDLDLSVNGHLLALVQDNAFTSGDVGMITGTFEEPGTDILFQEFVVTQAQEMTK